MRSFRVIVAVLLTLAIWPASNWCLLAVTVPTVVDACCSSDDATPAEDSCDYCVTLQSGVNLAALTPVVAPAPILREDEAFARLMQWLVDAAAKDVPVAPPPVATVSPPPLFAVTLSKALPVRGPSFAA